MVIRARIRTGRLIRPHQHWFVLKPPAGHTRIAERGVPPIDGSRPRLRS
jgi:hypothetical protein